jgi:GR25 family glycosyltransferase involved in LPS biosynthesis
MYIVLLVILLLTLFIFFQSYTCKEEFSHGLSFETILQDIVFINIQNILPCTQIKGLDCIYCITVNGRKDYIRNIFHNYGMVEVNFIEACTPTTLTSYDYEKYSTTMEKNSKIYNLMTKLPVHLSYLSCLYHADTSGYKNILIFEDDIYFEKPFTKLKEIIEDFLSKKAGDILYLGYCNLDCETKVEIIDKNIAKLPPDSRILCKHGMVHNTAYVKKLIQNHKKLDAKSDIYLNDFYSMMNIKRVVVRKPFIYQNRQLLKSYNDNPSTLLSTCLF